MQKKILSLLLLLSLLLPTTAYGAGHLQIGSVIAGLETQAVLSGFAAAQALDVHVLTPSGEDVSLPVQTDSAGNGRTAVPSTLTEEAGAYRAFVASAGHPLTPDVPFTIYSDRPDMRSSSLQAETASIAADGRSAARVTVTIRDAFGNALAGRPVKLISSRTGDAVQPIERETNAAGAQRFSVTARDPGQIILRAMDLLSGETLEASATVAAVNAVGGYADDPYATPPPNALLAQTADGGGGDVPDHFELTISPKSPKVGAVFNVTIRAVGAGGNTADGYVGTVDLYSPTDPAAGLPGFGDNRGKVTFVPKNLGIKLLPLSVSFSQPGDQILFVDDKSQPSRPVHGQVAVAVSGSETTDPSKHIEILSHKDGQKIKETNIVLEGIGPVYSNLVVTGGRDDVQGETDAKGRFSIPVELDKSFNEYAIRIRDDSRGYDSGTLHLIRDTKGPDVQFTIAPEKPVENGDVTVTAVTEPHLPSMVLRVANSEYTLTESADKPGTYQVIFPAPAAGQYQPTIVAKDKAGNTTEIRAQMTVVKPELPLVQNLRADAKVNGIDLHWDELKDQKVSSYLVYVGTGANDFTSTLDTKQPRDGATVMGLVPGVTYYFAVTAKVDGRESPKGNTVASSPLGLTLQATPQDRSVLLQWSFPTSTPLSSFLLEYGVQDGVYTEKRYLQNDQKAYVMRDLLENVTYYMHLTPIAVNGERINDLTAAAQATPTLTVAGFHPTANDPVPFQTVSAPSNDLHAAAPSVPGSGLSSFALFGVAGASVAVFAYAWHRRRMRRMTEAFLLAMRDRYHS